MKKFIMAVTLGLCCFGAMMLGNRAWQANDMEHVVSAAFAMGAGVAALIDVILS